MEASATRSGAPLWQLARWLLLAGLGAFFVVASLLALRRFAAADVRPLDPVAIVMLAAGCASLAVLVRVLWLQVSLANAATYEGRFVWALPTACLLLLGVALCGPGASLAACIIAWLTIAVEEGWMLWRGPRWLSRLPAFRRSEAAEHGASPAATADAAATEAEENAVETITQSVQRELAADGAEAIRGVLRTRLEPGQRAASIHVGFCPPLPRFPEIECEQAGGPEADVKLAQALPHGARFDVRLKRPASEATTVELAFHAVAERKPRGNGNTEQA